MTHLHHELVQPHWVTWIVSPRVAAEVVGEEVRGYVKPGADGKMVASSLTFGPKNPAKK